MTGKSKQIADAMFSRMLPLEVRDSWLWETSDHGSPLTTSLDCPGYLYRIEYDSSSIDIHIHPSIAVYLQRRSTPDGIAEEYRFPVADPGCLGAVSEKILAFVIKETEYRLKESIRETKTLKRELSLMYKQRLIIADGKRVRMFRDG